MPGIDLGNPNMWRESGGLIVLCFLLCVAVAAMARYIVTTNKEHTAERMQDHKEFSACLKDNNAQILEAFRMQVRAQEQNTAALATFSDSLKIYQRIEELMVNGQKRTHTAR